jgi:hypothetical protein
LNSTGIKPGWAPNLVFLKRYDLNDLLTLAGLVVASLSITALAQTSTVISDSEATQHIGQNAVVESVVTAVSSSKRGSTLINFGGVYRTTHSPAASRARHTTSV